MFRAIVLTAALCSGVALAQDPRVTISAVYGGGGGAAPTWRCDYVELHNRTQVPIALGGWSIQYASATGMAWQVTPLTGVIDPCGYFLVQMSCGAAGMPPPPPDMIGTTAMSNASGKVALVNTTVALVGPCPIADPTIEDFLGYGTANCWETAPGPSVAPMLSATASLQRLDEGCIDMDDNGADFLRVDPAPMPRNTQSQPYCCQPTGGACCYSNGACLAEPNQAQCEAFGGLWQGDGTACTPETCRPVACCFPDGSCSNVPAGTCGLLGGAAGPAGSDCFTTLCPRACCLPDGSCVMLPIPVCQAQGGAPQAGGLTCAMVVCPITPQGACCRPDGTCVVVPVGQCNGTYLGDGTLCTPGACLGACCLPDGSCLMTLNIGCTAGNFLGVGTSCVPNPCEQACCFQTSCADLPAAQCLANGGTPQGPGTTCVSVNFCREACCLPDGSCIDTLPIICQGQGGQSQGSGTACATTQCRGACCFPDGSCFMTPPLGCTAGVFLGIGTTCVPNPCREACCYPNGSCSDLAPMQCLSTGGSPQGPGTNCAGIQCPLPGCCLPSGACVNVPPTVCISQNGTPQNVPCIATTCPPDRCNGVLVGDANCDNSVNNFDIDFFVQGVLVGSPPDPTLAPPGYLALGGTQACWDRRRCWGDVNCDGLFNNFDIDPFVMCILAPPPPGNGCPSCTAQACCFPGGICTNVLPASCTLSGGMPQGAGSNCGIVICP
ncbi:MAG: lamin tail domain-containing protein [Phycisphaerales bacterium]|nr:lamin tail domain-containing protein [Phycisphaerales bacterium]